MKEYFVGQTASFSKTITEYDVYSFAGITGDFNGVHVNKEMAQKSIFGQRVAHGCLISSFVSTVLGMYMPGPGTIFLEQTSKFEKPVYIGDTITAEVIIREIDGDRAVLETNIANCKGEKVISGEAVVKLP